MELSENFPQHNELVDPSFVLTEKILLSSPERKGYLTIIPKFVPIEQVEIPWIINAAKSVYPITDIHNRPPGTAFHLKDGIWITNHHCVHYQRGSTMEEKLGVAVISTNPPTPLKGATYAPHGFPGYDHLGVGDIIVVQVNSRNTPSIATPIKSIAHETYIPSLMIGFPYGLPQEKGPYVSYGSKSYLYSKGFIGDCYLRNKPGNSGSPIFDNKGNLIGIFSGNFLSINRVSELINELA